MNDLVWKIDKRDWQAVAEQMIKEKSIKAEQVTRRLCTVLG